MPTDTLPALFAHIERLDIALGDAYIAVTDPDLGPSDPVVLSVADAARALSGFVDDAARATVRRRLSLAADRLSTSAGVVDRYRNGEVTANTAVLAAARVRSEALDVAAELAADAARWT